MKAVFVALFAGMIGCALVQLVSAADAVTYREKVLWSFGSGTDGQYPYASLINVNGTLYGTTSGGGSNTSCDLGNGCGTVFSLDPSTDVEKVLYSFCSQSNCTDGANPADSLINVKGTLYGTTVYGGSTGCSGYGC